MELAPPRCQLDRNGARRGPFERQPVATHGVGRLRADRSTAEEARHHPFARVLENSPAGGSSARRRRLLRPHGRRPARIAATHQGSRLTRALARRGTLHRAQSLGQAQSLRVHGYRARRSDRVWRRRRCRDDVPGARAFARRHPRRVRLPGRQHARIRHHDQGAHRSDRHLRHVPRHAVHARWHKAADLVTLGAAVGPQCCR